MASHKKTRADVISLSYSNIGISWLSSIKIVLIEEGSEFGLNTAQRLWVAMQQYNHIHHRETLAHQRQQVSKETCHNDKKQDSYNNAPYKLNHILFITLKRLHKARNMTRLYNHSLTHSISSSRSKEIAGLRKSLNKLGNTFAITLTGPQRTHHGGQNALHDARKQLRAQCLPSSTGRLWRVRRSC